MTLKEDYYRMLEGKMPASDVPYYRMVFGPQPTPPEYVGMMPDYIDLFSTMQTLKNAWGVEYAVDVNGTGAMPAPGKFMLTDVTKWKDIVKAPYRYDYDFKAAAEKDMAMQVADPNTQLIGSFGLGGSFFLDMSNFMGFEGAMLAMYDEPEAVHELLDYLCDYYCWVTDNILTHYTAIEIAGFGDDNATEINPFISFEMFKEFLLPRYKRLWDVAIKHGKIINYHNCGRCEDFMDDFVAIGTQIWNCATPVNDLNGFKKKYDSKIIMELSARFYIEDDEATTRQRVRDLIDEYAPGGALVWISGATSMNPEHMFIEEWIYDEVENYGKGFYA